jgi:endonuclease G
MPKRISKQKVEAAVAELDKVRKSWLRRPDVTAVDVGYKIKDNEITDELAIRVHVQRKLPVEALESYQVFSESGDPNHLGDFVIDVIEADYGPSRSYAVGAEPMEAEAVNRRSLVDPLVGGISVGHPDVTAGTLGAIVWDRTDCDVCILSNWHVLCGSATCMAGDATYQPGVFDGGRAADQVAELKRWRLDSDADAALARLTGARGYTRDILELNPIPGVEDPVLGMNVVKSGRTTGLTEGIIDGVSASLTINYGGGTVQTFHDQIHIVPRPPWPSVDYEVSKGGDSGSVWINESTGKAVGLHFAGERDPSPSAENAIANRMVRVAELLNFSFTPLYCPPPVLDGRLRDIIRRILCRHFPWLCGQWPPYFPPAGGAPPNGESAGPAYSTPPQAAAWDIDRLVDEIVEELRRGG